MKIKHNDIVKALKFYNISQGIYKKIYKCIDTINENREILKKFNEIYNLSYIDKNNKYEKLWKPKNVQDLFGQEYSVFITNSLLLLGYKFHIENIKIINFDDKQINIQKQRVKECLENDIIYKKYVEIRISQMLWGTYEIYTHLHNEKVKNAMLEHPLSKFKIADAIGFCA